MKKILSLLSLVMLLACVGFTSCDDHDPVDDGIHVGDVVFGDHSTMSYSLYSVDTLAQMSRTPVGVVFAEKTKSHPALVVLLREPPTARMTDSLGVSLGTSTALDSCLGRSNTAALFTSGPCPASKYLFGFDNGRSVYIPSVCEARLLAASLPTVNPIIENLGGTPVRPRPSIWYWTSTEVSGNEGYEAWTFSAATGSIQPTPKTMNRNIRAIIESE